MWFEHRRRALRSREGFTLIELLVVILIIAILIAVSAPSFLGQTQKAHDSVSQQYLTVAYKAATAWAVDHKTGSSEPGTIVTDNACASTAQGDYCSVAGVANAIEAFEPELQAYNASSAPSCQAAADSNPRHIFVFSASGGDLVICNDPDHTVWVLQVVDHALQPFSHFSVPSGPQNITPPSIEATGDQADVDSLAAQNGTWSGGTGEMGGNTWGYQWQSCPTSSSSGCSDIPGATNSLYYLQDSDVGNYVGLVVTDTAPDGASTSVTVATPVGPVVGSGDTIPANDDPPTIVQYNGFAAGQPVSATSGDWTPAPDSYAYQWQRCDAAGDLETCADISGAVQSFYLLTGADVDHTVRVGVTGTNGFGTSAFTYSDPDFATITDVLAGYPVAITTPWISRGAADSESDRASDAGNIYTAGVDVLYANEGTWDATGGDDVTGGFTYQWLRCDASGNACQSIDGAMGQTYTTTTGDTYSTIRVIVYAFGDSGYTPSVSDPTTPITPIP